MLSPATRTGTLALVLLALLGCGSEVDPKRAAQNEANATRSLTQPLVDEDADTPELDFDPIMIWGPAEVIRTTGRPKTEKFEVDLPDDVIGPFKLVVDVDGVSSAVVSLNGEEIFGPSDFNANVERLEAEVTPGNSSELAVEVRGKPGGTLALELHASAFQVIEQIGSAGGHLEAGGVAVTIPSGAAPLGTELTMTVGTIGGTPTIQVEPHTVFSAPVLVRIPLTAWQPRGDQLAVLRSSDTEYFLTNLGTDDDGAFVYTMQFSTLTFVNTTGQSLAQVIPGVWRPGTQAVFTDGNILNPSNPPGNADLCPNGAGCDDPQDAADIVGSLADARQAFEWIDDNDPSHTQTSAALRGFALELASDVSADTILGGYAADRGAVHVGLAANGGYSLSSHSPDSKHRSGRALDLGLCAVVPGIRCHKYIAGERFADVDDPELGRLAALSLNRLLMHRLSLAPQLRSAASQGIAPTTRILVWYEPNSQNEADHVHVDLAFRCPDPWSFWDSATSRCRRPKVTVKIVGEAATAGTVTSTVDGQPGDLLCVQTDPDEFECTEEPDGGLDLALTATVDPSSGAELSWSGDCSGTTPMVTFAENRDDIDCTATSQCPSGESWDALSNKCASPGGSCALTGATAATSLIVSSASCTKIAEDSSGTRFGIETTVTVDGRANPGIIRFIWGVERTCNLIRSSCTTFSIWGECTFATRNRPSGTFFNVPVATTDSVAYARCVY